MARKSIPMRITRTCFFDNKTRKIVAEWDTEEAKKLVAEGVYTAAIAVYDAATPLDIFEATEAQAEPLFNPATRGSGERNKKRSLL